MYTLLLLVVLTAQAVAPKPVLTTPDGTAYQCKKTRNTYTAIVMLDELDGADYYVFTSSADPKHSYTNRASLMQVITGIKPDVKYDWTLQAVDTHGKNIGLPIKGVFLCPAYESQR